MNIENSTFTYTSGTELQVEPLPVLYEEHEYAGEPYVYIRFDIPDDRWPVIKSSPEWKALCDLLYRDPDQKKSGSESEERKLKRHKVSDELDETIMSICRSIRKPNMIFPDGLPQTIESLAALVTARNNRI